jgi:hypothetical protein
MTMGFKGSPQGICLFNLYVAAPRTRSAKFVGRFHKPTPILRGVRA